MKDLLHGRFVAGFVMVLVVCTRAVCLYAAGLSLADLREAVMLKNYAGGAEMARELLKQKSARPDEHEIRYFEGLCLLRLGKYAEAEQIFRKLLAAGLSSDLIDKSMVGLIDALTLQGFYSKALQEANRALAHRKNSSMRSLFYLKAARANLKMARWAKAGELLRRIVADFPASFESDVARQLLEEQQYFTVQVGSFTEKKLAQDLVDELTRKKEYAYIVEKRPAFGKTHFRVRVGRLSTLKDAVALESKLSGLGYPTLIYP